MNSQVWEQIRVLFEYMKINDKLEKSDCIMGCGCANLTIPIRCADLFKQGYADYIIFAGGLGKATSKVFSKSEAEIFKEIAMEQGVEAQNIFLEKHSTNTPQNFINTVKLIKGNHLKCKSVIVVHSPLTTRRTLATAKAYFKNNIRILVTTPMFSFEEFMGRLLQKEMWEESISVLVGNIQRMIIAPQMNYQVEEHVPQEVIKAYYYLKEAGFSKYVYTVDEIKQLIQKHGLKQGIREPVYFV